MKKKNVTQRRTVCALHSHNSCHSFLFVCLFFFSLMLISSGCVHFQSYHSILCGYGKCIVYARFIYKINSQVTEFLTRTWSWWLKFGLMVESTILLATIGFNWCNHKRNWTMHIQRQKETTIMKHSWWDTLYSWCRFMPNSFGLAAKDMCEAWLLPPG